MERLTHKRSNGIKSGYWSPAKKEELVQRLATYEDTGATPEQLKIIEEEYSRMAHELAMLQKQRASVKPTKGQSLCPECGRHILRCYSFCPDCGSEIDWSEEIEQ